MKRPLICAELDEAGLTPAEFRVLCHISRRAGEGPCFSAVAKMATICKLHRDTVYRAIRSLEAKGLLEVNRRHGTSSLIGLKGFSVWSRPSPPDGNKGGKRGTLKEKSKEGPDPSPAGRGPGNPPTYRPKATKAQLEALL